jgi:hypothetical protein
MRSCLKCGGIIPWRIRRDDHVVSLTKRKFCLSCSPLYGRNTKTLKAMAAHEAGRRICPRCKLLKLLNEFYRRRDGRPSVYCKVCAAVECLERQVRFKEKAVAYKGGKCQRCGFVGPVVCYDFHHRDRATKTWSIAVIRRRNWDSVVKELEKCDLLCANCHRIVEARPRSLDGLKHISTKDEIASSSLAEGTKSFSQVA